MLTAERGYEAFDVEETSSHSAFNGHAKLTVYVFLVCLVAASGGILFGRCTRAELVLASSKAAHTMRSPVASMLLLNWQSRML